MKPWEKDLLRFAFADHAFQEADALAAHILELKLASDSYLLSGLLAGLVVSYCRPFMSASGLGSLPKTMEDFRDEKDGPQLRDGHNAILEARHRSTAHFDRTFWEQQHSAGIVSLSPSEVHVELQREGAMITTHSNYLNPNNLPILRELFAVQRRRVALRLGSIAVALLKEEKRIGTFVFKVRDEKKG